MTWQRPETFPDRDQAHAPAPVAARWERATPGTRQVCPNRTSGVPQPQRWHPLATLPLPLRRAVIMYYLGDMSGAEIAALEGTTVNAIKQRLHRGRAALAEHLVEPRPEVGNA